MCRTLNCLAAVVARDAVQNEQQRSLRDLQHLTDLVRRMPTADQELGMPQNNPNSALEHIVYRRCLDVGACQPAADVKRNLNAGDGVRHAARDVTPSKCKHRACPTSQLFRQICVLLPEEIDEFGADLLAELPERFEERRQSINRVNDGRNGTRDEGTFATAAHQNSLVDEALHGFANRRTAHLELYSKLFLARQ